MLSGHLHLTGVVRRNGVYHIAVSGTASYPCDFASYEVFADRIRMRVHSLPPNLVTPETDIHGKPRYTTDYTDAAPTSHTRRTSRGTRPSERWKWSWGAGRWPARPQPSSMALLSRAACALHLWETSPITAW